jgi:hypothetical protein
VFNKIVFQFTMKSQLNGAIGGTIFWSVTTLSHAFFMTPRTLVPPSNYRKALLAGQEQRIRQHQIISNRDRHYNRAKSPLLYALDADVSEADTFASVSRQIKQWRSSRQKRDQKLPKSCRFLLSFLKEQISKNTSSPMQSSDGRVTIPQQPPGTVVSSSFKAVIIEALRAAGEVNDYKFILLLIETVIQYATTTGAHQQQHLSSPSSPLLEARLFGEALAALSNTSAGPSKLRNIWQQMWNAHYKHLLSDKPSAFELNTMLKALAAQGKIRAALDLFHLHCGHASPTAGEAEMTKQPIEADSYTLSTIFNIFLASLENGSNKSKDNHEDGMFQQPSLFDTAMSPCWQWRRALELLEDIACEGSKDKSELLNNFVYTALLKLNERAADTFGRSSSYSVATYGDASSPSPYLRYHNCGTGALDILRHMECNKITPDVVTCTAIMSSFDKSRRWRDAVALFERMQIGAGATALDDDGDSSIRTGLPPPNEYTYAAAISACSRSNQLGQALKLLDQLRQQVQHGQEEEGRGGDYDGIATSNAKTNIKINTWVYNSALAAFLGSERRFSWNKRKTSLYAILDRMQQDAILLDMECQPNTVTYNTILAALSSGQQSTSPAGSYNGNFIDVAFNKKHRTLSPEIAMAAEDALKDIFGRMERDGVARDEITYLNSILLSRHNAPKAVELLGDAMAMNQQGTIKLKNKGKMVELALAACVYSRCATSSANAFQLMLRHGLRPSDNVTSLLLKAIGEAGDYPMSFQLLQGLRKDVDAIEVLKVKYHLDLSSSSNARNALTNKIQVKEQHYVEVAVACIHGNDIPMALKVVSLMKSDGITPSTLTYTAMTFALCHSALSAATFQYKHMSTTRARSSAGIEETESSSAAAKTRSKAALALFPKVAHPTLGLQSAVIRACAASGMWTEAIPLLHKLVQVQDRSSSSSNNKSNHNGNGSRHPQIQKLHRSLLSICARYGNLKCALQVAASMHGVSVQEKDCDVDDDSLLLTVGLANEENTGKGNTMTAEDWKLLMIAASKAREWRICLETLQILRPQYEGLVRLQQKEQRDKLGKDLEALSFTFVSALLCLEACDHYAWGIRAIDDWIKWTSSATSASLPPPQEAVFAACRATANSGQGRQVLQLLERVRAAAMSSKWTASEDLHLYLSSIYARALTAFYNNGDYNSADEVYCVAVDGGFLPWAVAQDDGEGPVTLDLHGMSAATAHSAVRVTLQREIQFAPPKNTEDGETHAKDDDGGDGSTPLDFEFSDRAAAATSRWTRDIIIITGRGAHSSDKYRPVVRPEVQRMLTEEFYPPLTTVSLSGNLGAVTVPAQEVEEWISFHREQRGIRMLALADVIRNLSSGSALRQSLEKMASNTNLPGK